MKQLKKIFTILLMALVFTTTPQSVLTHPVTAQAASSVKLNKASITLTTGTSYSLKISGTTSKVTWKSSKKEVATVTSKGQVKAIKNGTAYITAVVDKKEYKCKVIVLPVFNINKTDVAKEIAGRFMQWNGQEFTVELDNISDVEIQDVTTSKDKLTKVVTATMTIDRTVVVFDATVFVTYTSNTSKWSVSNVSTSLNIKEYNISGSYIGNVIINPKQYNDSIHVGRYMDLCVNNMKSDGIFTGTITLSANADSPTAITNVYTIKGGVNTSSGLVTIVITDHTSGDDSWSSMANGSTDDGFYVDVVNKGLSAGKAGYGNGCFAKSVVLTKNNPNTILIK